MVKRNPHFAKLAGGYLFPEINKRKLKLLESQPNAKLISLSIGDTTEPLTPHITEQLVHYSKQMGTLEGYSGYGPDQGFLALRKKIADVFYKGMIDPDEIFISDGAKCDIARLQFLFGSSARIAIQDPSYPVYVDTSVMAGQTGNFDPSKKLYQGIAYMACHPQNNFFPDLTKLPLTDLVYFCSPNNPTGAVATSSQLKQLVEFCSSQSSILIYDAAYSHYIQDNDLPTSIYQIPGAKNQAIEINSFSKLVGFTGVRLAWSVVPKALQFDDGSSVHYDWHRLMQTCFNGASVISQQGGLAALDSKGQNEIKALKDFYMENTHLLRKCLQQLKYEVYGGLNAPYLWVKAKGQSSWEAFEELLYGSHIVTTPGSGFGPAGEGFLRFSAFSHRAQILEAIERLGLRH